MSDRIAVMGNGHIEQVGSRTEIFEKPSSSYVASFWELTLLREKQLKFVGLFGD